MTIIPLKKFGSLFSGIGGMDIGLERAGLECRWQCEIDDWQREKVLPLIAPDAKRYKDVCGLNGAEIEPVDLIAFGSPCQDLSCAGAQKGLIDGERSNLFFEAIRIVGEMDAATNGIYPRIALWENVAGAFSSNAGADFKCAVGSLAGIETAGKRHFGHVEWFTLLTGADFGHPHRRKRVFVVAYTEATHGWRAERENDEGRRIEKTGGSGGTRELADADSARLQRISGSKTRQRKQRRPIKRNSETMENTARNDRNGQVGQKGSGRGVCETGDELEDTERGRCATRSPSRPRQEGRTPQPNTAVEYQSSFLDCEYGSDYPRSAPSQNEYEQWKEILQQFPYLAPALEQGFRCMVDGLPFESDINRRRWLKGLGNAVVTQAAQWIGERLIKTFSKG